MVANYTNPSDFLRSTTRLYFAPLFWVARLLRRVWDRSWASVASLPKPRAAGPLSAAMLSTNLKAVEALHRSALDYVTKVHDTSAIAALYSELAMTYLKERNIEEAEKSLIRASEADPLIQRTPEFLAALGNIGWTYHVRGDLDKAEEYYVKALQTNSVAKHHLAALYFNLGLISNARHYFERAAEIDQELHNWGDLAQDYLYLLMTRKKLEKLEKI